MNPFTSLRDYESFIYTLRQNFSCVKSSNLVLIQRGRRTAVLRGEIIFDANYRIVLLERLSFDDNMLVIEAYGYEIWRGSEKTAWYDSQPHPDNPALMSSHPHHKHVPPDIKNNRIPAPHLSFSQPNIPVQRLIASNAAGRKSRRAFPRIPG
jgi:hypothetical protein